MSTKQQAFLVPQFALGSKRSRLQKKEFWSRCRVPGGGRKTLTSSQPKLAKSLDRLVDPSTRGDPESSLRWTCKSLKKLSAELVMQGFKIGPKSVSRLLKASGYSLQSNRKTIEGKQHPDRNAQFEYINKQAAKDLRLGQPFISVDTKKKENVGFFRRPGREWCRSENLLKVLTHDFSDDDLGKVVPYGIYDVATNSGMVNVGVTHDTPEFAVASISLWWRKVGKKRYIDAKMLFITADCGGSNSYSAKAWKFFLQRFASRSGLNVHVRHFPPGTRGVINLTSRKKASNFDQLKKRAFWGSTSASVFDLLWRRLQGDRSDESMGATPRDR